MAKKQKIVMPKRGEVYMVNFDPATGSEMKKTRPALILQNNVANEYSPVTIVAAITSFKKSISYPTEVVVLSPEGGLIADSVVLLNQIRTIDKQRLIERKGNLKEETMDKINGALEISLGLIEIL